MSVTSNRSFQKYTNINNHSIRDDVVVRTLASHQCFPGLIPRPGVICGLSLLMVLYSAPSGFFSGYSSFPLSSKTNISKFQFDLGIHRHFWMSSCELLGAPWVNKLHVYILQITYLHIYIHTFYSTLYMYGMLTTDTPKFKPLYILWYKILDMYVDVWQQYSVWLWIS